MTTSSMIPPTPAADRAAAGLVATDRYRYWTYYRLRPDALLVLAAHLRGLAMTAPSGLACRRPPDTQAAADRQPHAAGGIQMARHHQLDPISRQAFAAAIESLADEFRGVFSIETIERYVDESIDR